jgi:hypothetical protein
LLNSALERERHFVVLRHRGHGITSDVERFRAVAERHRFPDPAAPGFLAVDEHLHVGRLASQSTTSRFRDRLQRCPGASPPLVAPPAGATPVGLRPPSIAPPSTSKFLCSSPIAPSSLVTVLYRKSVSKKTGAASRLVDKLEGTARRTTTIYINTDSYVLFQVYSACSMTSENLSSSTTGICHWLLEMTAAPDTSESSSVSPSGCSPGEGLLACWSHPSIPPNVSWSTIPSLCTPFPSSQMAYP